MKQVVILLGIIVIVFSACVKIEPVSPIPEITFTSLDVSLQYDPLGNLKPIGKLVFYFIDGDADFGMYLSDIIVSAEDSIDWNLRNYNVIMTPYMKINSNYYPIEYDTTEKPPPWYRAWHNSQLDRVGQNKTIKGTITIIQEDLPDFDTIRFDFYIRDRAGNKSNTETTTDVGTRVEPPSI